MLTAHDLTYSVEGRRLLDAVSVSFPLGAVSMVVGANGAGKSTLLRALCRSVLPQQGVIHYDGRRLADWTDAELARYRAVLSQNLELPFPIRVQDVVLMHEQRQAQLRRLDRIHDDELANSTDMNHDAARHEAQQAAVAMHEAIQRRQAQFRNPSPAPVAAAWQPPAPFVFDEADSARLAEAVTSASPPRGNSASEAASTAWLPAAE